MPNTPTVAYLPEPAWVAPSLAAAAIALTISGAEVGRNRSNLVGFAGTQAALINTSLIKINNNLLQR